MTLRHIKLTIAYDGSNYHGWQEQPGKETIQGLVKKALKMLTFSDIEIVGASRTDAGVNALGQVVAFKIDSPIPTENFSKAITDKLPPNIIVTNAEEMPLNFDVIKSVKRKLYRYTIHNGAIRPVLHLNHCWHIPWKLDVTAMNKAATLLKGKKDFKSFASAADSRENSVRTIFHSEVTSERNWVYYDVEGNGFLYNMVRNIVGTLVEIGRGKYDFDKITKILKAKHRTAAGQLAPPHGLCLMWIKY